MSRVAIIKCDDYDEKNVQSAVQRGMDLLGGMESFIKAGEKILLKPNLLAPDLPEKCVTTHPAVFRAVAEVARGTGAVLRYGDSPAMGNMAATAKKCGIQDVADELDIEAADFKNGKDVTYEKGHQNKRFTIATGVLESDGLISISKLKTHGFEKFTGAVKNQFGCVPGLLKGEFHVKVPDAENFARMLLDLNGFVSPRLYVMDAVMAMEGNGPRGGRPVKVGALLFSDDPVALDSVACRMIKVDPSLVPTVRLGEEMGYGKAAEDSITLLGDSLESLIVSSFDVDRKPLKPAMKWGLIGLFKNRVVPKPVINEDRCLKCGVCVRMCPADPKAVDWFDGDKKKVPTYNYKNCIRCYCCQELCPESAIVLKSPLLRRFLLR